MKKERWDNLTVTGHEQKETISNLFNESNGSEELAKHTIIKQRMKKIVIA